MPEITIQRLTWAGSIGRCLLGALVLYPPYAAFATPNSIPATMRFIDAWSAYPVYAMMIASGLLIILDAILAVGSKRVLMRIVSYRHWVYLLAAFCAIAPPFTVAKLHPPSDATTYLYMLIFGTAVAYAWLAGMDRCRLRSEGRV